MVIVMVVGIHPAHADDIDLFDGTYAYTELRAAVQEATPETVSDEFHLDLNGDGAEEVFLGVTCGNAGCVYYLFSNTGKADHKFLGTIGLHKLGF